MIPTAIESSPSPAREPDWKPAPGTIEEGVASEPREDPSWPHSQRTRLWPLAGVRTKVVFLFILLMAVSAALSVLFIRQILLIRLDEEIGDTLTQEVQEFRRLAKGTDPQTGRPFGGDIKAIFDVYFSRNVPGEGEKLFSIVGDEPYRSKGAHDVLFDLDNLTADVARWASLTRTETGELRTSEGYARYLAIPIKDGGEVRGAFVVANFPSFERQEIEEATRVTAGVSLGALLVASLLVGMLANRVVRPLRALNDTALSISGSDLSQRIDVRGHDEVAQLGATFNDMLDRLQEAFGTQKKLTETQRQFVDDAGHELKTPITIIRGHIEVLGDDPAEREEALDLVIDELDRMSRIVNDLLLLARAQQPDFLDVGAVDVGALTSDLYSKARALGEHEWRLENTGRGIIEADRHRLTQAVLQLAHNATQHTSNGDLIVLGSAVVAGEAHFWVRDTGPGIPYEEQEHVFERFARATMSPRRSDGVGLGLSIVRAIAEGHQGRVELRSRPGAGATFTVVIPVDQPRAGMAEG